MESKDELKEIDIKNRTCYYFDDTMGVGDIYFIDVLLDEKSYEFILIYDITYKTFMGEKPLRIRLVKLDGFIKICNGIRHLEIFGYLLYYEIYNRMRYLLSEKSGSTDSINHNFAKVRIDSYTSLPVEEILTFHNAVILIKSVVNKNKNEYYYNIVLEKDSYKDKSNTQNF